MGYLICIIIFARLPGNTGSAAVPVWAQHPMERLLKSTLRSHRVSLRKKPNKMMSEFVWLLTWKLGLIMDGGAPYHGCFPGSGVSGHLSQGKSELLKVPQTTDSSNIGRKP